MVSPTSGSGAAKRQGPNIVQELRRAGLEVEAELTESLDHARHLASEAAKAGKIVVAVGGDGLVNAVVNGVAPVPGATIGVIPLGTANDLARSVCISKKNALDVIRSGAADAIDLGWAGGKYFTCIASTGFDSKVIELSLRARWIKSPFLYPYCVLRALSGWKPERFTVHSNGSTKVFEGFSVAAANARCFGGGMQLAPDAVIDDGLFDVVLINTRSRLHFLRWAPMIFSGTHTRSAAVEIWRTDRLVIETSTPQLIYADGEILGPAPLEIEVRPAAVNLLMPAKGV